MGKGTMAFRSAALFTCQLVLAVMAVAASNPTTSPAFLWSPHYQSPLMEGVPRGGGVNYQTITSRDLAKSLMLQAGWSTLLCSEKEHHHQPLDLVLIFVGRGLSSSDISTNNNQYPSLMYMLKDSFTRSNFSMAFPYVATSDERIENALVSEFVETCKQDSGMAKIAISESCSVQGENLDKLSNLDAVNEYLVSRMENRQTGVADVVVICTREPHFTKGLQQYHSESEAFSKLISFVESVKAKYAVLFVSDPLTSVQYPSHRSLERFLAEGGMGNGSLDSTFCNEVCQIKSSLLEGALVAVVLLIILISGLCCMMGIDTPTRFEAPKES